jgi:hypothetical protein
MLLPREGAPEAAQQPETPFGAVVEQAFARNRPADAAGKTGGADPRAVDPGQIALCAGAWAAGLSQTPCQSAEASGDQNGISTISAPEAVQSVAPDSIQPATPMAPMADTTLQNAAVPGKAIVVGKAASVAKLRVSSKQGSDASEEKSARTDQSAGVAQVSADAISAIAGDALAQQAEARSLRPEADTRVDTDANELQGFGANAHSASPVAASAFAANGAARFYEAMGAGLQQSDASNSAETAMSGFSRAMESVEATANSDAAIGPEAAAKSGTMMASGAAAKSSAIGSDAIGTQPGSFRRALREETSVGMEAATDRNGAARRWSQMGAPITNPDSLADARR